MESIKIQGKEYITVNERIKEFRKLHPNGQILNQVMANADGQVMFQCKIIVDGVLVATAHAYEKEGSSFINKTSYIENCETSAVGRALGLFGIGIDTSIASAEEVGNAVKQQSEDFTL
jgi:type IV secretory pathway protease TraF